MMIQVSATRWVNLAQVLEIVDHDTFVRVIWAITWGAETAWADLFGEERTNLLACLARLARQQELAGR